MTIVFALAFASARTPWLDGTTATANDAAAEFCQRTGWRLHLGELARAPVRSASERWRGWMEPEAPVYRRKPVVRNWPEKRGVRPL